MSWGIGNSKEFTFIWQQVCLPANLKILGRDPLCILYWLLLWAHYTLYEEVPADLLWSFSSGKALHLASKTPLRASPRLFLQPNLQSIDLAYFLDIWFKECRALGPTLIWDAVPSTPPPNLWSSNKEELKEKLRSLTRQFNGSGIESTAACVQDWLCKRASKRGQNMVFYK